MAAAEEDRHLRLTGEFDCDATPLATLRHSTSHVMAQAVKRLHPGVKLAIGPAIEDGFYYDFAKPEPFTPEDLAKIDEVMREIAKADYPFQRQEMTRADAVRFFREVPDACGKQEITTPVLASKKLCERAGHWEHYQENMFLVESEEQIFSLKPMNCPESTLVYRHALRSYRDLPLRFSDMGRLH